MRSTGRAIFSRHRYSGEESFFWNGPTATRRGYSHGGYVVSRVACFEPRVNALVPVTPLVDAEIAGGRAFFKVAGLPDWLLRAVIAWNRARNPAVVRLIRSGEGKDLFRPTDRLLRLIASKHKSKYVFRPEIDGSDDHVQLDNRQRANAVMFDGLDDVFGLKADG